MPKSTLPVTPLTIDGEEYKLVFNFRSIAEAERLLVPTYPNINLVAAKFQALDGENITGLFLAGLLTHHKALVKDEQAGFEPALDLLDEAMAEDSMGVLNALNVGYRNFAPVPERPLVPATEGEEAAVDSDPPQPGS